MFVCSKKKKIDEAKLQLEFVWKKSPFTRRESFLINLDEENEGLGKAWRVGKCPLGRIII